jgi:hypothetical protein
VRTAPTAQVYAAARVYLLAVHNELLNPAEAVQLDCGLTRSGAAYRLKAARALGLLPVVGRGRRVFGEGHWPRAAQWCHAGGRKRTIWTACQECCQLWPCPDAATLGWLAHLDEMQKGSG